jgi:hypothetical protein
MQTDPVRGFLHLDVEGREYPDLQFEDEMSYRPFFDAIYCHSLFNG